MKCVSHNSEAVAICAYCGRALCRDCVHSHEAARMVCSKRCADALTEGEKAMQMMLQHGRQNAKASAFYCYLCAGLSAAAAIAAWFMLPSPFLILFTGGCALVLTASGAWYSRIACQHSRANAPSAQSSLPGLDGMAELKVQRREAVQSETASRSGAGC